MPASDTTSLDDILRPRRHEPVDMNGYTPRVVPVTTSRLEPEYTAAFSAWHADPTPQTSSALLTSIRPVLDTAVRPLGGSPALYGRAKQIALTSLRTYDPQRASLRTHLLNNLQGLRRIAGQQEQPIRVPERVVLDSMRVARARAELADTLYRDPTDEEIADHTGISTRRLARLRQQSRPVSESGALWVDDEGNENAPAVTHDTPQALLAEYVRAELSPQDRLLLDYAAGADGQPGLSGREIAQRLGITPSAVSQRLARIQARFRALEDMRLFGD